MAVFYSKSAQGFFDSRLHETMPADVVAVSDATHAALFAGQAAGQIITSDASGNPVNAPRPAPVLTLAQQATVLLGAGLTITSASMPAINGLYAVDSAAQAHIQVETMAILLNGTFADGSTFLAWPDMIGAVHTFPSVAAFKVFANVVSAYVAALFKVGNGTSTTLPSATATIP